MKRIVTVQDVSAIGKCSLTVALPIISAMGVECAVIPTAVLSTHTAFSGFTFHDLTSEIDPIAKHWAELRMTFDAIYTGYLGSFEQLAAVNRLFDAFGGENTVVAVDPCMADNGCLYKGFTAGFAAEMARLCARADVVLPNLTEASYLLGIPYVGEAYDEAYIKDVLVKLTDLGAKSAVLTGVCLKEGRIGAMCYDSEKKEFFFYDNVRLPVAFHGTGDIFASTVVGALARGKNLNEAVTLAVDYTLECIRLTVEEPDHNWYGVNFEQAIPMLCRRLEE